jgi:single-strand DNA-binding protein
VGNSFPISVTGRLTSDPTLVYSSDGTARSDMRIAVDDRERAADGAWTTKQTVFHQLVAWGQLAENAAQTLAKGDAVVVAGELRFRTWHDSEANRERTASEVRATTIGPDLRLSTVSIDRTRRLQPERSAAVPVQDRAANAPAPVR